MQYILSVAALAGVALAQMGNISAGPAPAGCEATDPNSFQIQTVTTSAKSKRQAPGNPSAGAGQLTITLTDGKLTDSEGRTGYIADNRQFQFDFANGQAGTIYNAGWSVCPNGTLALGPTTVFYQCLSGNFYNLYDQSTGNQCSPINILTIPAGANTGAPASSSSAAPSSSSSAAAAPAPASSSAVPSQIPDGQVQAPPAASQIPDGQVQSPAASQIPDGQVQAPAASQIPDGQVQAPAAGNATYSAPVPQYTGAASALAPGMGALAAGAIALALL